MKSLTALTVILTSLVTGAGIDRAAVQAQTERARYHVVVAGSAPVMEEPGQRSIIAAEACARELLSCPETEQEAGRPILILDQSGRLIDTVTR